ncbi:hypothetical protein R4Z10_15940 [Niallia sp. XMNu-256]|uniref:hypothetical protein n=1 Tax=Niallia sp. XMNu-256 TaxID=3082444 RepID=UPI0030D3D92B
MQENRKQLIINEIFYWKKSRLLPEHYCDFLLALYTKGEGLYQQMEKVKPQKFNGSLFLLIPIGVFLFYFTELSLILQIVFSLFSVIIGIYVTFILAKKDLLYQIPLILTALLILFVSLQLTLTHTSSFIVLYSVIGTNGLLWLITGLKYKQLYFTISGIAGLILLMISVFQSITLSL